MDPAPVNPEQWTKGRNVIVAPATADPKKGSDLVKLAAEITCLPVVFSANLPADLPRARCLLYLSRSEGLGSAALLAMAFGVPVIASRAGGLLEAVRDGETGILTDNRLEPIAAAMRRLWDSPAEAFQMGVRARRRVEEEFAVKRMVDRTFDAYREVAGA